MYGWSQIVIGIGCVILAFAPFFDSTLNRIWIGGFVLGPILVVRGVRALKEDAEAAEREARRPAASATPPPVDDDVRSPHFPETLEPSGPDGLATLARKESSLRVQVTCEACSKPYVYFPEATDASLKQYMMLRHCFAPCPQCGWVQKHMVDLTGHFKPLSVLRRDDPAFLQHFDLLLLGESRRRESE
jgi:hypothetical protein